MSVDEQIASVVPLLNIGDQNVRIRVIMWSTDAVAVLSVSNDKDQSETRTQKWHWSHVSGPDSLATVISVIAASSVTLIIINFAFGHFLTYVLFLSTIQSGRFISGHVPDLPSYSVCTNCGVFLGEIPKKQVKASSRCQYCCCPTFTFLAGKWLYCTFSCLWILFISVKCSSFCRRFTKFWQISVQCTPFLQTIDKIQCKTIHCLTMC